MSMTKDHQSDKFGLDGFGNVLEKTKQHPRAGTWLVTLGVSELCPGCCLHTSWFLCYGHHNEARQATWFQSQDGIFFCEFLKLEV